MTYIGQLSFQFACYFVGIVFLYVVAVLWVTNTNYFAEDNVIVPEHVKEDAQVEGRVGEEDIRKEHRKEDAARDKGATADVVDTEDGSNRDVGSE